MTRRFTKLLAGSALLMALTAPPAHAAPQDKGRCIAELARAGLVGRDVNPKTANIVTGTEGDDDLSGQLTAGPDVVCGFGGNDTIGTLAAPDIFLGGAGFDLVSSLEGGTFNGGPGYDTVAFVDAGTFNGGEGDDVVQFLFGGTFNGGEGDDRVDFLIGGTFNGGPGNDTVIFNEGGTFNQD